MGGGEGFLLPFSKLKFKSSDWEGEEIHFPVRPDVKGDSTHIHMIHNGRIIGIFNAYSDNQDNQDNQV